MVRILCLLLSALPMMAMAEDPSAAGIGFLCARQEADGSWNDRTHHLLVPPLPEDPDGSTATSLFATGLALRALLVASPMQPGDPRLAVIGKGLDHLLKLQDGSGAFSPLLTDHAVATHALVLAKRTGHPGIDEAATRALDHLAKAQNVSCAWPARAQEPERIDLWTTFWCLQAVAGYRRTPQWPAAPFPSTKWRNTITQAIATERPELVFPSSFFMTPDGSWSFDPTATDASEVMLYHQQVVPGPAALDPTRFYERLRQRLAESANAPIDWRMRLALMLTGVRNLQALDLKVEPIPGMVTAGAESGSWPAHGPAVGRVTATAFALIIGRLAREERPSILTSGIIDRLAKEPLVDGGWPATPGGPPSVATTAMITLALASHGYDHKTPNRFKRPLAGAMQWLLKQQDDQGFFHPETRIHAMVTCALTEFYAMTNDRDLRQPGERAVSALITRRVDLPGSMPAASAWPTGPRDAATCDTATTKWSMMALKSALAGGLEVGDSLERTQRWITALLDEEVRRNPGGPLRFPAGCRWDAAGALHLDDGDASADGLMMRQLINPRMLDERTKALALTVVASCAPAWGRGEFQPDIAHAQLLGLFLSGSDAWRQGMDAWMDGCPIMLANSDQDPNGRLVRIGQLGLANAILLRWNFALER